jgi:hypothetical protein
MVTLAWQRTPLPTNLSFLLALNERFKRIAIQVVFIQKTN